MGKVRDAGRRKLLAAGEITENEGFRWVHGYLSTKLAPLHIVVESFELYAEELDREAIMQNRPELPPLEDAPADLAGLRQARLERIWGLLEMPVPEKLE